jgi:LEA14-like dessication related protein
MRIPTLTRRVALAAPPLLLATTLALSGCATLSGLFEDAIEDPQVTILGVELRGMSLDTISTTFQVKIDNPNAIGLYLAGIEYQLNVDGKRFAQGQSQDSVLLVPLGATEATLDVDFPLDSAGRPLLEVLKKDRVHYTLDTVFLVGTKGTNLAIPARFEGDVDLPKAPEVDVVEVAFPEVSREGIQVRLVTHVTNPNAFDIPIDELRVSFFFGGREILKNQPIAGVVLPQGQTTVVPVDFTVSLADLGVSLGALADRPELRWKLVMRLVSGNNILPYDRGGQTSLVPSFSGVSG